MPSTIFRQLPLDSKAPSMKVKTSTTILMKCSFCPYDGPARIVTGRTKFPLYLCPACSRRAVNLRTVESEAK